ncbi:MAG TPA: ATP phosphoribosyltransferase [Longimicrobium sp.]|nr:ATP phosphoribosyltransferase [Longimicrobium sp.]
MRKTVLAVPKNCALGELEALLVRAGIALEPPSCGCARQLRIATSHPELEIVLVRNWDTVTLAELGAADLAVVGSDVLSEHGSQGVVPLLDLNTGRCRLSLAAPAHADFCGALRPGGRVRVATSYPLVTQRHFRQRGMEAECIVLQGSVEVAPSLGLGDCVVDIVATGRTLRAHGLVEVECITEVSARLVASPNLCPALAERWADLFRSAVTA